MDVVIFELEFRSGIVFLDSSKFHDDFETKSVAPSENFKIFELFTSIPLGTQP